MAHVEELLDDHAAPGRDQRPGERELPVSGGLRVLVVLGGDAAVEGEGELRGFEALRREVVSQAFMVNGHSSPRDLQQHPSSRGVPRREAVGGRAQRPVRIPAVPAARSPVFHPTVSRRWCPDRHWYCIPDLADSAILAAIPAYGFPHCVDDVRAWRIGREFIARCSFLGRRVRRGRRRCARSAEIRVRLELPSTPSLFWGVRDAIYAGLPAGLPSGSTRLRDPSGGAARPGCGGRRVNAADLTPCQRLGPVSKSVPRA